MASPNRDIGADAYAKMRRDETKVAFKEGLKQYERCSALKEDVMEALEDRLNDSRQKVH